MNNLSFVSIIARETIVTYLKDISKKDTRNFTEKTFMLIYLYYRKLKCLFLKLLKFRYLMDTPRPSESLYPLFCETSVTRVFAKSENKLIAKSYLRIRNHRRHKVKGAHNFVTIDELVMWTNEWIKLFPSTYDVIVGIPRSGLLIANIIAVRLGKPLSTPELFIKDKYWKSTSIEKKRI